MANKGSATEVRELPATGAGGRSKSETTRRRILDAAAAVFREAGYAGARLSDIAARAGTKAGSLYYHFDSREALVERVLDEGLDRAFAATRAAVDALPPGAPGLDRLATAIRTHLVTILELDNYTSASVRMLGHVPEPIRSRHMRRQAAYGAWWRSVLEEAAADGGLRVDIDLSAARMLVLGMLNWSSEWYHPGRLTPAQIADQAVEIALRGLAAPKQKD